MQYFNIKDITFKDVLKKHPWVKETAFSEPV